MRRQRTWRRGGAQLDTSNVNRPSVWLMGDEDPRYVTVNLDWSNGNSDPVWAVWHRIRVPRRLGRRVPM